MADILTAASPWTTHNHPPPTLTPAPTQQAVADILTGYGATGQQVQAVLLGYPQVLRIK